MAGYIFLQIDKIGFSCTSKGNFLYLTPENEVLFLYWLKENIVVVLRCSVKSAFGFLSESQVELHLDKQMLFYL